MAAVTLQKISKNYGTHQVIKNLDLNIKEGEFVTFLGPSGCGKTTLLRMIAGLEPIDNGTLLINGVDYKNIPAQKRPIAMVFQSYALFPHLTVKKNILFGLKIKKYTKEQMQEKLDWVLPMFGLNGLEERLPKHISGGQKQRVALARALVLDPDVLLLDEPLSNLDAALRELAMEELKRLHQKVGKTIVYVSHNQIEAMTMSGRIALLKDGHVEQFDTPKKLYDLPRTIFAAEFIGSPSMNFVDGEMVEQDKYFGVKTSFGFLALDKDRAQRAAGTMGRKVRVGIRPQYISFSNHLAARRRSDSAFKVKIELIETMGDRSLIIGTTERDVRLRFLVTRDEDYRVNDTQDVFVDGRKIHVFDPDTGINLFFEKEMRS